MNIKTILTCLAVLTLSFNVFALEVPEKPKIIASDQTSSVVKVALNQENSPDNYLASQIVNSHKIPQAPAEEPSEFLTSLTVCLFIIIVYSIYGFRANSKNIRNWVFFDVVDST